jgi:DNA polymerase-3 subunit alpha
MAVLITLDSTNAEKMAFYLEEAKTMKLAILPSNINTSEIEFSVPEKGKILFGLQGIKNVGPAALVNIIEQRKIKPFTSLFDFCMRVDLRVSNKRVIEHLIFAGAFDTVPGNRAQKIAELTNIIDLSIERKREKETGQMGLFGFSAQTPDAPDQYAFQPLAEWPDKEKLEKEKEVMGFYVSAHPLDSYKNQLQRLELWPFDKALKRVREQNSLKEVIIVACGILKSKRTINTKKGDRMAFVQLEDYTSAAEIVVFPSVYKKVEQWLNDHTVFIVKGAVDQTSSSTCKILANELVPLELFFEEWKSLQGAVLTLPGEATAEILNHIKTVLPAGKLSLAVEFYENGTKLHLKTPRRVMLDLPLIKSLEEQNILVRFLA